MYDILIIGSGPAGMTAAIYLARKKMKIAVISKEIGGQTAKSASVENYPGIKEISGTNLIAKIKEHMDSYNVETKLSEASCIKKIDGGFEVEIDDEKLQTKALIISSGKTPRKLDVPGEKEFAGKGLSYCATCDGPLFQGKEVAVLGGGNSALDSALELEKYASKVYLLNLNENFQGDEIRLDKIRESKKAQILTKVQTTEVFGTKFLEGLKYKDLETGKIESLNVSGIFVEIGWVPSSAEVKDLVELNQMGEIKIDQNCATSCEGIYAAGDVTDTPYKQIIIASGEGAKAALSAWKYVITHR